MPPKYDPPYAKKSAASLVKHHHGGGGGGGGYAGERGAGAASAPGGGNSQEDLDMDSMNKMLSFGNMPSYSRGDSQRVLFRPVNHTGAGSSRYQEHKLQQQMKRLGVGSGSEEDPPHSGDLTCNGSLSGTLRRVNSSGIFVPIQSQQQQQQQGLGNLGLGGQDEETVSFIDLPHQQQQGSKLLPEKGILKKQHYGSSLSQQDKWGLGGEDSQSDTGAPDVDALSAALTQAETAALTDMLSGVLTGRSASGVHTPVSGVGVGDMERTLKSLNGYHDDIIEALRTASSHSVRSHSGGGQDGGGVTSHAAMVETAQSGRLRDDLQQTAAPPIRIRNLEDLIRQLEHHSARRTSPSGSEDLRTAAMLAEHEALANMSAAAADRHYRLESSAACSESSQGSNQHLSQQGLKTATILPAYSSRCRPRASSEQDQETSRFVYGRYRHPPQGPGSGLPGSQSGSRHSSGGGLYPSSMTSQQQQQHSPHMMMTSSQQQHGGGVGDEEALYESADHHRHTPDSESDAFIQARRHRSAGWEVTSSDDEMDIIPGSGDNRRGHQHQQQQQLRDDDFNGDQDDEEEDDEDDEDDETLTVLAARPSQLTVATSSGQQQKYQHSKEHHHSGKDHRYGTSSFTTAPQYYSDRQGQGTSGLTNGHSVHQEDSISSRDDTSDLPSTSSVSTENGFPPQGSKEVVDLTRYPEYEH